MLQAHWVPDLNEVVGQCWLITSRAQVFGSQVRVGYIALEPQVHRRWPNTMIALGLLLAGKLGDRRIRRDILVRGAFGIAVPLLDEVSWLIATRLGIAVAPALSVGDSVNLVLGLRNLAGSLAVQVTSAVSGAVYVVFWPEHPTIESHPAKRSAALERLPRTGVA